MGRKKTIEDEQLLSVARKVFIENGIGAPTKEIARQAGVSEGVVFQRYPTKNDLFFAAMIPPPPDVESIMAAANTKDKVSVQFEEIALVILSYFREMMPLAVRLMTHPSFEPERYFEQHSEKPESILLARLIDYLKQQQTQGKVKTEDPASAAGVLVATLHSLALFEIMGAHGGKMEEEAVRAMVRSLWNGLAP